VNLTVEAGAPTPAEREIAMRYRMLGERQVSALCLGTLPFGTTVEQATSFALLDRFVERGGNFVDTANNYCCWIEGCCGDESEMLLGRWLAKRTNRDEIVVASKVGARPDPARGTQWPANREGLAPDTVAKAARESLRRLGTDHVDLLYGHADDPTTPLEETLAGFDRLVREGLAGQVGISNQTTDRLIRSRTLALEKGCTPFTAVQQRHTYLRPAPRADFGIQVHTDQALLSYAAEQPDLTVLAYGTLINGALTHPGRQLPPQYRHSGAGARLLALRGIAEETGATANQVVLAWLMQGPVSVLPVLGVSTLTQLDEALDALGLELTAEQRERLDHA
jgi:aryl-alcohol dehydrogenase-like predicted oxidoreductase